MGIGNSKTVGCASDISSVIYAALLSEYLPAQPWNIYSSGELYPATLVLQDHAGHVLH